MAAFSSFPLDSSSILLPNTPAAINSQFPLQPENPNASCHLQTAANSNANSQNKNCTMDSSSVVTVKSGGGAQKAAIAIDKKRKCRQGGSSANSAQSKDKRKAKKTKEGDAEKKSKEEAPTGYIHVRARRGQATDSHSLAERVRRERISERMKLLQALVPGCDKVTGKALMLDEIINYVQSLKNQVEFLSMKLASVNPTFYDFGMELESLMFRPDQMQNLDLSNFSSPFPLAHNYPLLENSENSIFFPPAQNPSLLLAQGSRQALWETDEQRQKIINQCGFSNHSLFSFN